MKERMEFDQDHGRGGAPWFESVLELRRRVRSGIADVIWASPEQMALTASTTDGCNIVVAGLGLGPEDEVITTNAEHPGLLLPLHVSGATVRVADVAGRPTEDALERLLALVTPRTRLFALSHVLWTTGQVMPVHELKRASGLTILVDGAQSAGAIPVEVGDLDYYTVSCQKWLCGPDPSGALYVRDVEALRVAIPSYFAQASIEPDGGYVPREHAERFDAGWISPPYLAGLEAALEGAPPWRYDEAAEQAARCRAALAEHVEVVPGEATLVSFVPSDEPAAAALRLYERDVVVRNLPGTPWVRASCGWWTNPDDIDRLVAGLQR
jgi:L-cysteine/cystine lyase